MKTAAAGIALLLACITSLGQDFSPAWSNNNHAAYPQISKDMRVRLQIKAPDALKVQAQGGEGFTSKPVDMVKDENGVWSVEVSNLTPGFHYYWFLVDGVRTNDPSSFTYYGYNMPTSGFFAPTPGEDFLECKDVPHGDIREHWYFSTVTGEWRSAYVYTPAGYDSSKKKYPILYLLHGAGESEKGWALQGRMNFIMDNLIAEGKCEPMVVVMNNGYATAVNQKSNDRYSAIRDLYVKDIIPHFESAFRIMKGSANRAIAGLSMGGAQTMYIALNDPSLFAYIGGFSAAFRLEDFNDLSTAYGGSMASAADFNKKVKLLWYGAGRKEADFVKRAETAVSALNANGIPAKLYISENTYHEWHTWSRCLHEFAPLIFK